MSGNSILSSMKKRKSPETDDLAFSPTRTSSSRKKMVQSPVIRIINTDLGLSNENQDSISGSRTLQYNPDYHSSSVFAASQRSYHSDEKKQLSKKISHKGEQSKKSSKIPPPLMKPNLIIDDDVIIPDVSGRGGMRRDQGLRTLSFKICAILQERKIIGYEELLKILNDSSAKDKRFRRRVYDTMKVLKATDVIEINEDNNRELSWYGMPNSVHPDVLTSMAGIESAKERIRKKKEVLEDLVKQFVSHQKLITSNLSKPLPRIDSTIQPIHQASVINTPFIIMKASKSSDVDVSMDEDCTEILINCSDCFSLIGSHQLVNELNLEPISRWDLERILPENFVPYYPNNLIQDQKKK